MKLAIEFPSVIYREGQAGVVKLAQAIEQAGYDHIDVFDHVVMEHQTGGRPAGRYPAEMPILEALVTLGFIAAVTQRVGLGTEVLVLPQRQPVLAAKQLSSIDTLSGGRLRVGVGVGWQESEFDALGMDFRSRGRALDEGIALLRACWTEREITLHGRFTQVEAMAMSPRPPTQGGPPIWIGGASPVALKRAGTLGDGWLANAGASAEDIATVRRHAEQAGRDPTALGFQTQLASPPKQGDQSAREFFTDLDAVAAAAGKAAAAGFGWLTFSAVSVFLAGARRGDQLAEALAAIHDRLRQEVG